MSCTARKTTARVVALLLACAATGAFAQEAVLGKTRARSPFMPKGAEGGARPTNQPTNSPLDQIEFRGIVTMGGQTSFSVFDPAANRGYWLKEGESQSGYTLVSYNKPGQAVTLRSSAGERSIPLKTVSTAAAAPGAGARPGVAPLSPMGGQPAAGGVVGPSAANLPSGSFPVGAGQPVPPGYTLAQALPSTMPNALPAGTTFALPPGNPIPPGFAPVAQGQQNQPGQQPTRRRIIVNPQPQQQQQQR